MRIQRQHGLDGDVHALEAVLLEHDLRHPLAVRLGVHRGLGEEHLAPAGVDAELLVKGAVPEELHVLPVARDAVLHRLGDLQEVARLRGLVADHDVLDDEPACCPYAFLCAQDRSPDDGGEDWWLHQSDMPMKAIRYHTRFGDEVLVVRCVALGAEQMENLSDTQ